MEIVVCKIISVFFLISWLVSQFYIIDKIIDTKKQYRDIMWKIIISSICLGMCAFLCGVSIGSLM